MHDTTPYLYPASFPKLSRRSLDILQINIGLRCNLACLHCHVNSNPYRKEKMSDKTIQLVLECLKNSGVKTLDITGGSPEMHPQFRFLVNEASKLGVHIIDRCNLTILNEPGYETLAKFLAENKVEVVASLPCYTQENVDQQRGKGVFDSSITALQDLNQIGYGKPNSGLILNLVYNPTGPTLPPPQNILEMDYKNKLYEEHGIVFNSLYTICNMPINRFGSTLISQGKLQDYFSLLKNAHSDDNLENVMCRNMVSVDWDGYLYDCDFNQMLSMNITHSNKNKMHLSDMLTQPIITQPIRVADHCFGCTAGQGSSCGGALTASN
jgi:radical SAM/Cys-rich protein